MYNKKLILYYLKNAKYNLYYIDSLSKLLFLIKFSQNFFARRNFYITCCLLCKLNHINETFLWYQFVWTWKNSIFFLHKNPIIFFNFLEAYYTLNVNKGVSAMLFTNDYFFNKLQDNNYIIKYNNYFFKTDNYFFILCWSHIEVIRKTKYNEYIKHIYSLNNANFLPSRHRYKRQNFQFKTLMPRHTPRRTLQKNKYLMELFKGAYIIYYIDSYEWNLPFMNDNRLTFINYYANNIKNYLYNQIGNFKTKKLLSMYFFETSSFIKLNLISHKTVIIYPNDFMELNRLDWEFFLESNIMFLTNRYPDLTRWRELNYLNIGVDVFTESLENCNLDFYFLCDSLSNEIKIQYESRFIYDILSLYINDFIDTFISHWITSWVKQSNQFFYKSTRGPKGFLTWAEISMFTYLIGTWIKPLLFLGNYYAVDNFFTKNIFWLDYYNWRMLSADSENIYNGNGRLDNQYFLTKIDLDNLYEKNFLNVWMLFRYLLKISNNLYKKHIEYRKFWHWQKAVYWGPKIKIISWLIYNAITSLYIKIYKNSIKMNLLFNIIILNNVKCDIYNIYSINQQNILLRLLTNFYGSRIHQYLYRDKLTVYRRFPNQNCIISKNDISYWNIWFSYMDRMRRAGIKYTNLPYYIPNNEQIKKKYGNDYIKHLYDTVVKPKKLDTFINKYWVIYDK